MRTLSVAAYQSQAIYGDVKKSLSVIKEILQWAQDEGIDVLCFPECFLQGYILDEVLARKLSFNLNSQDFNDILAAFKNYKTTLILGIIEKERTRIFNTAAIIENGQLKGKYRKQHLLKKENFFSSGTESPVFDKNGIKYGINICYDTRFSRPAQKLAKKGAQILFFLLNNSLPHDVADQWKSKHVGYWMKRAKENSCWVITADVVEKSKVNTGYGFTTIINPDGKTIGSVAHLKQGRLKHLIRPLRRETG